ncbi:MAG TPA: hypothetical protein VJJ22_01470 [Candidatus Paceibacterota bacterium]
MDKLVKIIWIALPVIIMIGLVPVVKSDYLLAGIYLVFIVGLLIYKRERGDVAVLASGIILMTIFEFIFVSTGVEVFVRNSLFGLMPIWLPLLWGYGFLVIRRVVAII